MKLKLVILNLTIMQTTFLSAVFLTALGYLLSFYPHLMERYGITLDSAALQFSGAIIAAIFWVSYITGTDTDCKKIKVDIPLFSRNPTYKACSYAMYTGPLGCTDVCITFL